MVFNQTLEIAFMRPTTDDELEKDVEVRMHLIKRKKFQVKTAYLTSKQLVSYYK